MKTPTKYLFLIGGHDLEMKEIIAMLLDSGQEFLDRKLPWGAKLSNYADVFSKPEYADSTFVGIELEGDITAPLNYLRVDHHNDLAHLPAAILQIASLLGIQPNRWHQLVAANDSGFIPAMEAIGASPDEIKHVRAADRNAQGVTAEDEILAADSIANHARIEFGVTIIRSLPELFTPITDRMYGKCKRLLVYREDKLTYYGEGAGLLGRHFAALVASGKAYHGGGDKGYFGLDQAKFEGQIGDWIAQILEALEDA